MKRVITNKGKENRKNEATIIQLTDIKKKIEKEKSVGIKEKNIKLNKMKGLLREAQTKLEEQGVQMRNWKRRRKN